MQTDVTIRIKDDGGLVYCLHDDSISLLDEDNTARTQISFDIIDEAHEMIERERDARRAYQEAKDQ